MRGEDYKKNNQRTGAKMKTPTPKYEEIAEKVFREYFVPLYSLDKPISEMTSYEQGTYKQTLRLTYLILSALREWVLAKKEYNPRDYCQPTDPDDYKQGKTEGYNQALEDIANLFR